MFDEKVSMPGALLQGTIMACMLPAALIAMGAALGLALPGAGLGTTTFPASCLAAILLLSLPRQHSVKAAAQFGAKRSDL